MLRCPSTSFHSPTPPRWQLRRPRGLKRGLRFSSIREQGLGPDLHLTLYLPNVPIQPRIDSRVLNRNQMHREDLICRISLAIEFTLVPLIVLNNNPSPFLRRISQALRRGSVHAFIHTRQFLDCLDFGEAYERTTANVVPRTDFH